MSLARSVFKLMFHRQARLSQARIGTALTTFEMKVEISETMVPVIVCAV